MPARSIALLTLVLMVPACAAAPPRATADPAFDDARACARGSRQIDRVEGDVAVVIDAQGRSIVTSITQLPPGAAAGDVLVDGVRSGRCAERMRAYVRALRDLNANTGDTSNALRLQ